MDSEDNLKFKKIIEDVEELGIEYDLDDNLIKNIIVEIKNDTTLVFGFSKLKVDHYYMETGFKI